MFESYILSILTITTLFIVGSNGQNCSQYTFPSGRPSYPSCITLPSLSSFLHWNYNSSTNSVAIAYRHASLSSNEWVVWALNPSGKRMIGAQCLVAFQNSSGAVQAYTSPVTSYDTKMPEGPLSFKVSGLSAEYSNNQMTIYATIELPAGKTSFKHLWQDGRVSGDTPLEHRTSGANVKAYANIDFANAGNTAVSAAAAGDGGSGLDAKDIHGLLNVASWGILMPLGVMSARYLKVFTGSNPAWFYLHLTCQVSAYIVGVAGWATGLRLGDEGGEGGEGGEDDASTHRNIGFVLFAFGTLQAFALLLRPKPDHKYRFYWNIYHHTIGYSVIVLAIVNIFGGLELLDPEQKWKTSYIGVLVFLGACALVLEPLTWCIVLKRRQRDRANKYHQPTTTVISGQNDNIGYP